MRDHQLQRPLINAPFIQEAKDRKKKFLLISIGVSVFVLLAFCCIVGISAFLMLSGNSWLLINNPISTSTKTSTSFGDVDFRVVLIYQTEGLQMGDGTVGVIAVKNKSSSKIVRFENIKNPEEFSSNAQISDEWGNKYKIRFWLKTNELRPGQEHIQLVMFETPVEVATKLNIKAPTGIQGQGNMEFNLPITRVRDRISGTFDNQKEMLIFYRDKNYKMKPKIELP